MEHTGEDEGQRDSRHAADECHKEREFRYEHRYQHRHDNKQRSESIHQELFLAGERSLVILVTTWDTRKPGFVDYGEESECRQCVGEKTIQAEE